MSEGFGAAGQKGPAFRFTPIWLPTQATRRFVADVHVEKRVRIDGAAEESVALEFADGTTQDTGVAALPEDAAGGTAPANRGVLAEPPVEVVRYVTDEAALQRAREEGRAAGIAEARDAGERAREQERQRLRLLWQSVADAAADPARFAAPLIELSVHLAEEIVRGELLLSGHAIRRLVENCLSEIEQGDEQVEVSLHPEDLAQLRAMGGELPERIALIGDPKLLRGDVRVEMARGLVEDLVAHKLESLSLVLRELDKFDQPPTAEEGPADPKAS